MRVDPPNCGRDLLSPLIVNCILVSAAFLISLVSINFRKYPTIPHYPSKTLKFLSNESTGGFVVPIRVGSGAQFENLSFYYNEFSIVCRKWSLLVVFLSVFMLYLWFRLPKHRKLNLVC